MSLRSAYRITVFIPPESVPALQSALQKIGDLSYGNYSDVLWLSSPGKESFMPLPGSTPTLGIEDEATTSSSVKVVFSVAREDAVLGSVIDAIRSAYP